MKKILLLIAISLFLMGCGTESTSYEATEEAVFQADYDIPEEELPFKNFEHEHSFNDTVVIATDILKTDGVSNADIPRILVDSNAVREVIKDHDKKGVSEDTSKKRANTSEEVAQIKKESYQSKCPLLHLQERQKRTMGSMIFLLMKEKWNRR